MTEGLSASLPASPPGISHGNGFSSSRITNNLLTLIPSSSSPTVPSSFSFSLAFSFSLSQILPLELKLGEVRDFVYFSNYVPSS